MLPKQLRHATQAVIRVKHASEDYQTRIYASGAVPMDPKYRFCQSCKGNKLLNADHFKALRAEEFSKTCMDCLERRKQNHHNKKSNKENVNEIADSDDESSDDVDTTADFIDMSAVNLDAFLDLLSQRHEDIKTITARIDVTRIMESDMRTTADKVSEEIWKCMKYRFQSVINSNLSWTIF